MNEISPNIYSDKFNNIINKFITSSVGIVKNNIPTNNGNNLTTKKKTYLNTYVIPIFFLIFSYYYSNYYLLNKRIIINNNYLSKIENLNFIFSYNNPCINNVNVFYYKYFNSLKKNNKNNIDIDISQDILNLKNKIFNDLKNISKSLIGDNNKNEISESIINKEKNKNNILVNSFENIENIQKTIDNTNHSTYNDFIQYFDFKYNEDDKKNIKYNIKFNNLNNFKKNLKNYTIKFTIKNNIINFIDNLIKKETYFEIKKDIDSLVNNINKILKDQNDIKILNYNIKYFIDSVNKLNDKNKKNFIEILKNYEQSIEIYKEYLKNNNNNKNTKKIKSNIFKDKINQQLIKISSLISDVSKNNNKKYYNEFYINYILKYIDILNKFEKNYIIYKFKLNTNNISKFNEDDDKNPIYTLKNIKEDFKIFSKEKEKGKQNNNNNLKNSFNDELKKIDTKIENVNQEISNLTNEQKKSESYKNNNNYKNLNSNIKSNQQKIKTMETKIKTIDDDKDFIQSY